MNQNKNVYHKLPVHFIVYTYIYDTDTSTILVTSFVNIIHSVYVCFYIFKIFSTSHTNFKLAKIAITRVIRLHLVYNIREEIDKCLSVEFLKQSPLLKYSLT